MTGCFPKRPCDAGDTFSVGRLILTKSVGSDVGEDVTWQYKNDEGTAEERLAVFNAVRGIDRAMKYYDVPDSAKEDVFMDLVELESVQYGQPYKARVILEVININTYFLSYQIKHKYRVIHSVRQFGLTLIYYVP